MNRSAGRRAAFTAPGLRHPTVVFFTSSNAKFVQAKIIFERSGLRLTQRAHSDRPYRESYDGSTEDLLTGAIDQIQRRGGGMGSFFFVEDTSIRIEAISLHDADVPGLRAKEWFDDASFDELNTTLERHENRSATVKSCIALSIPGLASPVFFYGETNGEIAERPAEFTYDPFHPWLAPDNFSAWLVPDGATQTLSEMSAELSMDYDFRAKALFGLVDRLEEYAVVMNSTPTMYSRIRPVRDTQPALFEAEKRVMTVVVGPTCAGKSTFGAFIQQHSEVEVIDASSVVRRIREERGQTNTEISIFVNELLESEGSDVIARIIAESVDDGRQEGVVVLGFRLVEEIEYVRHAFDEVSVVSIEAPERSRFERYLRRETRRSISTIQEFREIDGGQHLLGLLPVAAQLSDIRILNNGTLDDYYRQVAYVVGQDIERPTGIIVPSRYLDPGVSQVYRSLTILRDAGRPLTTQEISASFPFAAAIRHNNVNKMLKRYPALAQRQESGRTNVKYSITPHGLAFLSAVGRLQRGS